MYYNKNEITLLYNGERPQDRKTLAMAMSLSNRINRQDLHTTRISETLFYLFLEKLGADPKDIVDKSQPYYQHELRGSELSISAWYQLLIHHPELLKAPLALFHDKAIICNTPTDMMKVN